MKTVKIAALALLAIAAPFSAIAQWAHQEYGSAFDTSKTHIALTSKGQMGVGLRCTNADDLTVIFITSETMDEDTVKMVNIASPDLLIRVDQNDPYSLSATADITDGKLAFFTDAPTDLATELVKATSKVSAATRLLGEIYHETEFNVRGSTATINKLVDGCGITLE